MIVKLHRQKTANGGIRQVWEAIDLARDYVGRGSKRKTAIRTFGPAENLER